MILSKYQIVGALLITLLLIAGEPQAAEYHIGTITSSYHFDRSKDYNESHHGIFIARDRWSVGYYENSHNDDSAFVSYHHPMYKYMSAGFYLASGYEKARPLMPIIGVNFHYSIFYAEVTPIVIGFGLSIPIGDF